MKTTHSLLIPLIALSTASAATAQREMYQLYELPGPAQSIAVVGDIDKDGLPDVMATGLTSSVYSGLTGGLIREIKGLFSGSGGEVSGAGCGDINGDGFPDVLLGENDDPATPTFSGKVEVISGQWIATGMGGQILHTFKGTGEDAFGIDVAGIGDVDKDGVPDIAVGAFQYQAGPGYVRAFSGRTFEQLWQVDGTPFRGTKFGFVVSGAGDVNDDGFPDVVTGAGGYVQVLSGTDGALIWSFRTTGDASVGGIGDLNFDGYDDVIVGDRRANSVKVYSGKDGTALLRGSGDDGNDSFGDWVDGAGDINKDGIPDLIVGAPRFGLRSGYAVVLSGGDRFGKTILGRFHGGKGADLFGWDVAGVGDVNGDDFPDVMVAAPPGGSPTHSSSYVFSGKHAVTNYGTGLSGTRDITPVIGVNGGLPRPGNSRFNIFVAGAIAQAPCMIVVSLASAETPFADMTLYGDFLTPGAFTTWNLMTGGIPAFPGSGNVTLSMPIPNDPSLIGLTTYWQGFVMDSESASPIGVSHTDGLEVTVVLR